MGEVMTAAFFLVALASSFLSSLFSGVLKKTIRNGLGNFSAIIPLIPNPPETQAVNGGGDDSSIFLGCPCVLVLIQSFQ